MSDRTWGQAIIVACPAEHVAAVVEVLQEYDLGDGDPETLVLGEQYTDDQMTCGASAEIAGKLEELDGVAFLVSEDPRYDWLGEVHFRLPDGRSLRRDADAEQNIVLIDVQYRIIREQATVAMLDEYFGVEIVDEWRRLRDELLTQPVESRTLTAPEDDQ